MDPYKQFADAVASIIAAKDGKNMQQKMGATLSACIEGDVDSWLTSLLSFLNTELA